VGWEINRSAEALRHPKDSPRRSFGNFERHPDDWDGVSYCRMSLLPVFIAGP
jgi:hypothetical protein